MRCPVDGTTLALTERAEVEIDYCPQCRGVWLDRGELDRIIERYGDGRNRDRDHDHDHDHDDHHARRYDGDRRGHDDGHDRRHRDDEGYHGGPRRKRGGAFTALTDLLGGGD